MTVIGENLGGKFSLLKRFAFILCFCLLKSFKFFPSSGRLPEVVAYCNEYIYLNSKNNTFSIPPNDTYYI